MPENVQSTKDTFPGYEIVRKIGQGGMGAVFLAKQLSMDRLVALKVLPKRLAKNPEYKERFFREARAAGRLNHPNIVTAIDAQEHDGYCYLAMEYVEGEPVSARLKRGEGFSETEALSIIHQIATALSHAWEANIVHRDVKPENFLYTTGGTAKLCDLGIAKAPADAGLTQEGTALGTPRYISPEQARGKEVDFRSDIYSLGASLYHLLAGRPPFDGPTAPVIMLKHINDPLPPLRPINPSVSAGAAALVEKMMAKDPAQRYGSAENLLDDIMAVREGGLPTGASPVTALRASARRLRSSRSVPGTRERAAMGDGKPASSSLYGIAIAAGAAVLAGAVGVVWLFGGGGEHTQPVVTPPPTRPVVKAPVTPPVTPPSDPDADARAAFNAAELLLAGGKTEEAKRRFREMAQKWPNSSYAKRASDKAADLDDDKRILERRRQADETLAAIRAEKDKLSRDQYVEKLKKFAADWNGTPAVDQGKAELNAILETIQGELDRQNYVAGIKKDAAEAFDGKKWDDLEKTIDSALGDSGGVNAISDDVLRYAKRAQRSSIRVKSLQLLDAVDKDKAKVAAIAQLGDRNEKVRIEAAHYAENNKIAEAKEKLQKAAKDDPSPAVRNAAANALKALGD